MDLVKLFLAKWHAVDLVAMGIAVFSLLFALLVLWTFRRTAKADYDEIAALPMGKE